MQKPNPTVLYFAPEDPWQPTGGGQGAFANRVLTIYKDRLAIVSHVEDESYPEGKWLLRDFDGVPVYHFNIGRSKKKMWDQKLYIPLRLRALWAVKKHIKAIRSLEVPNLFCDSQELLGLLKKYKWESFCYCFPGFNDNYEKTRYLYLRPFAKVIYRHQMKNLAKMKPQTILAAADSDTINQFQKRFNDLFKPDQIISFPTRVDTKRFYPMCRDEVKEKLGIAGRSPVFAVVGRYVRLKGWELILDSLNELKKKYPDLLVFFVGNGEDRLKIEQRVADLGMHDNVKLTGIVPAGEVSRYINAADICLVASFCEGWSLAMLEMLACGKCVVSTRVSAVDYMIKNGKNGFIVESRGVDEFKTAIEKTLSLLVLDNNPESLVIAEKYSLKNLASDFGKYWGPMRRYVD